MTDPFISADDYEFSGKSVAHDTEFYQNFFSRLARDLMPEKMDAGDVQTLIQTFARHGAARSYSTREIVISEGEPQTFVFFLLRGSLRCYNIDRSNGREITNAIYIMPGMPGLPGVSLEDNIAAIDYVQALEETEIILLPLAVLRRFSDMTVFWKFIMSAMDDSYRHYLTLLKVRTRTTEERCKWLYKNQPELVNRVQKQYLASLLDMDKSVYSRCIRKLGLTEDNS